MEAVTPTENGHKHAKDASVAAQGHGHDGHDHEGDEHVHESQGGDSHAGGHSHGGHSHGSMNMRGVFLHVLGDA